MKKKIILSILGLFVFVSAGALIEKSAVAAGYLCHPDGAPCIEPLDATEDGDGEIRIDMGTIRRMAMAGQSLPDNASVTISTETTAGVSAFASRFDLAGSAL